MLEAKKLMLESEKQMLEPKESTKKRHRSEIRKRLIREWH